MINKFSQIQKETVYKKSGQGKLKNDQNQQLMSQQSKNIQKSFSQNNSPPQYNKLIVGSKTQNIALTITTSKVQIKKAYDLILAFNEIFIIWQNIKQQESSMISWVIVKNGANLRLGLQRQLPRDLQAHRAVKKSAIEQQPKSSHDLKNKSVSKKYKSSQKSIKSINSLCLAQWITAKLFNKKAQTYLLILPNNTSLQSQTLTITILNSFGLPSIQIFNHQFLVFRPAADLFQGNSALQQRQSEIFEIFFGQIFQQQMNLNIEEFDNKKFLSLISPFQGQQNPKNSQQRVKPLISKEKQSLVRQFIENSCKIYNSKNIDFGLQALGCTTISKDRIFQDLQISKMETYWTELQLTLEEANNILRQKGFFSLKNVWKKWLKQKIYHVVKHFQIYQQEKRFQLLMFARMHEFNLLKIERLLKLGTTFQIIQKAKLIYELIYPNIVGILDQICLKLNVQNLRQLKQAYIRAQKGYNRKENQAALHFEKQIEAQLQMSQLSQEQRLFIKQAKQRLKCTGLGQIPASQQIYQHLANSETNNLAQLFRSLDQLLETESTKNEMQQHQLQRKHYYLQNIENQKTMNNGCLGCSRFFYQNFNFFDSNLNQVPLKAFKSLDNFHESNTQLLDTICGMLNSQGGIILFDCEKKYTQIKIQGSKISQNQKQQYQQKLVSILTQFYPKIDPKDICLTFVPVYKNPQESKKHVQNSKWIDYQGAQGLVKRQPFFERSPLTGVYVARIVIRPNDLTKTYIFSKKDSVNTRFYSEIFKQGASVNLPMRSLKKFMVQKIKNNYFQDQFTDFKKNLMRKERIFDHICDSPEIGIQISTNDRSFRPLQQQSNLYQQLTIVFCQESKVQQSKSLLQSHLRGLKYLMVQNLFPQENFFSEKNALYLFHNEKFHIYYQKLKNLQQENKIFLVNVVQSLKLLGEQNELQLKTLKMNFQVQFLDEELQLFEYKLVNNNQETKTKKAIVFLYHYLKVHLQKFSQIKFPDIYDSNYNQLQYEKIEVNLSKENQQSKKFRQIVTNFAQQWNHKIIQQQPSKKKNMRKRGKALFC